MAYSTLCPTYDSVAEKVLAVILSHEGLRLIQQVDEPAYPEPYVPTTEITCKNLYPYYTSQKLVEKFEVSFTEVERALPSYKKKFASLVLAIEDAKTRLENAK